MRLIFSSLCLPLLLSCAKKVEPVSIVGWHQEEGWSGACYYPPDFDAVEASEGHVARKMKRQDAWFAMVSQWNGERPGIDLSPDTIARLEESLLGFQPDYIEEVAQRNLSSCKQLMGAGTGASEWKSWLGQIPGDIMSGRCLNPLTQTYFQHIDLGASWQLEVSVCEGDQVGFSASTVDRYRVSDDGEWITVEGIPGSSATGTDLPCNLEDCLVGQLVGKYEGDNGITQIFPIGSQKLWTAPGDGRVSVTINDTTYFDNTWYQSGGVIEHAGVTIGPVD